MEIDRTEVVAAICNRMDALRLRYAIVFNPPMVNQAPPFVPLAEALADGLAEGAEMAVRIARALVDFHDLESGAFWAIPFGRLLFLAGGWRRETVPQAVAASVLGVSRQWIHTLVKNSDLDAADPAYPNAREVYTDQVRAMLAAKIDKTVK